MTNHVFREFEEYAAAIEDADVDLTLPRLEYPHWEIDSVSAGAIHLQYGREGGGMIAHAAAKPGAHLLFIPASSEQFANGQALEAGKVGSSGESGGSRHPTSS